MGGDVYSENCSCLSIWAHNTKTKSNIQFLLNLWIYLLLKNYPIIELDTMSLLFPDAGTNKTQSHNIHSGNRLADTMNSVEWYKFEAEDRPRAFLYLPTPGTSMSRILGCVASAPATPRRPIRRQHARPPRFIVFTVTNERGGPPSDIWRSPIVPA